MHRRFWVLFLLIFSIAVSAFSSSDSEPINQSLNVNPTVTPTPFQTEDLAEIVLDKKIVCHPCPPGYRCRPNSDCVGIDMIVKVASVKPENNQFKYEYTVSGGRVIGEGAKVNWDLTGAQPGTYEIKIGIEEKSTGRKRTEIETVTAVYYEDLADCFCPTLLIDAPTLPTKAGEVMIFIATISGWDADNINYNWTVSAGKIIEGQGTPVIKVATNSKLAGKTIKATVEIEGVCEVCPKTESAEGSIATAKRGKK